MIVKPSVTLPAFARTSSLRYEPQCAEVSDAFNLRPVQDRKHLVPSRFDDQTCGYSHIRRAFAAPDSVYYDLQPLASDF